MAGASWALDVVEAPEALRGSVAVALARVAVVDDLAIARSLVQQHDLPIARAAANDLVDAYVLEHIPANIQLLKPGDLGRQSPDRLEDEPEELAIAPPGRQASA